MWRALRKLPYAQVGGSECEVPTGDGMIHVRVSNMLRFAAAREAFDRIGEFIRCRV